MILRRHSNALLEVFLSEGIPLDKVEYIKGEEAESDEDMIHVVNSNLYFYFEYTADTLGFDSFNAYYSRFARDYPPTNRSYNLDFDELKDILLSWIEYNVRPYLQNEAEPDYWDNVAKNELLNHNIDFGQSIPFTAAERTQLKIGFEEIKLLVSQHFDISIPQLEATNQKLDYLLDATERLNKTDWKGVALSTMFSIASDLMLDEQKRATFFGLFSKIWAAVQHLPNIVH